MRKIKRGDIFYINRDNKPVVGSEQRKGRPAVVVSNDANNQFSAVVEVVYLTTRQKTPLPTHVLVNSRDGQSTALCEQVSSVSVHLLGRCFGRCSGEEMKRIDHALGVSLGLVQREKWKEDDGDAEKLDQAV